LTSVNETASDREQPSPWGFWLGVFAAWVAVLVTVGWVPSLLMVGILLTQRFVLPDRPVVASAAVVCLVALPILWFVGSSLPFTPAAPRIRDNTWAHQVGGLAVWLLFIAAWKDRHATPPRADDDEERAVIDNEAGARTVAVREKGVR
jgi:hypothetical protein